MGSGAIQCKKIPIIYAGTLTRTLFDYDLSQPVKWLAHYAEYIDNLPDKKFETISGADAAKSISQATFQSYSTLGFDRVEATRLGLKAGDVVTVTSDETGSIVHCLSTV